MAGDARDGAAAPTLARSKLLRGSPILLSGGSGGDGHLADGGRTAFQERQTHPRLLAAANSEANPDLLRVALKLATGAGKTTVIAMLIAWQTVNAVRRPGSKQFTRGFLVVTPGLTIKDRLRVLQPNDPDNYYASRELVPGDMLDDLNRRRS